MPLTPQQAKRVADDRLALRVAKAKDEIKGGAFGLYTPKSAAEMLAWEREGPPPTWYDELFNTALFILTRCAAGSRYLLFLRGAGDPQAECYSVRGLPGGRGPQLTFAKINSVDSRAQVTACAKLGAAPLESPEAICEWAIAQI